MNGPLCRLDKFDGGGEHQRRLSALLSSAQSSPVIARELAIRNQSNPHNEGPTGDQRGACRLTCRVLLAQHPIESVARYASPWLTGLLLIERP
ncbi:hypothetical protein [Streptomyces aquilus]|uniref:hypothetical protein n=1 Tax=Streptomyces aquilus TaxID=2548456 RepID=UPI001416FCC1|nr:hypothetical protein [Streptomyces aquilus]